MQHQKNLHSYREKVIYGHIVRRMSSASNNHRQQISEDGKKAVDEWRFGTKHAERLDIWQVKFSITVLVT